MITIIMIDHPLPHSCCRSTTSHCGPPSGGHALRMRIINISAAKMIAPEIIKLAIRSLIIWVPFLPGSPSLFI